MILLNRAKFLRDFDSTTFTLCLEYWLSEQEYLYWIDNDEWIPPQNHNLAKVYNNQQQYPRVSDG